ncbi:GOLPH3/VPS74 family protein [Nocardia sp. R16R-3T]
MSLPDSNTTRGVDRPAAMSPLADDLAWLLLDDETGQPLVDKISMSRALAGAVLIDLISTALVRATGPGDRVELLIREHDPDPSAADPIITHAAKSLRRPHTPKQAIQKLAPRLHRTILDRLCETGRVHRQSARILGFIPITVWPTIDHTTKTRLRQPLQRVVLDAQHPDHHTLALISLLHVVGALPAQCSGWRHRIIDERAEEIRQQHADSESTSESVRQAICDSYASTYTGGGLHIP